MVSYKRVTCSLSYFFELKLANLSDLKLKISMSKPSGYDTGSVC